MFRVKRLYTFILQSFLPLFIMTFFICLFVVMMQFLWRYVNDLVGKGLSFDIVAELFFYAALTMVPLALPLSVLLASLMTFGNLGEKFELTALKASGISLFKIMRPLIVLMTFVAIGAFFFQNNVLPVAQTKMWTIMFSVRQKNPEVEIPEKSFYTQIPNVNLFIDHKNPETGVLYGMIIYDLSKGMDNSRVILADSGSLAFTEDNTHLFLHLYDGEMFENLRDNSLGVTSSGYMPFRREQFTDKQILMSFDANFNRMDEDGVRNQYVGKDMSELLTSIDSIGCRVDSVGSQYASEILAMPIMDLTPTITVRNDTGAYVSVRRPAIVPAEFYNVDSLFTSPSASYSKTYINQALNKARRHKMDYEYRSLSLAEEKKVMRMHQIELQRKFTLSFACLIFFFIGAPLGAIIKKGGLGTPLVISILLFIVYFIIDNAGFKMARDGKVEVYQGIWLSSAVLLPLGVFFTYKAVGDSAVFNVDAYRTFFATLFGRAPRRHLEPKEVVMKEVDPQQAALMLQAFAAGCAAAARALAAKPTVLQKLASWTDHVVPALSAKELSPLRDRLNDLIDYLSNSRDPRVIMMLNNYPFIITSRNLPAVQRTTEELMNRFPLRNVETVTVTETQQQHGQQD